MKATHIKQWIEHPESLNQDTLQELRALLARYPYFQTLRLLYLKNLYLLHDAAFGEELRRSVLYVADRRILFYLIEGDRHVLQPKELDRDSGKMPEGPGVDRTLFLIDSFLSSFPDGQQSFTGLDYPVDYTAYLGQEVNSSDEAAKAPKLRGQALIDGFLSRNEEGGVHPPLCAGMPEAWKRDEKGEENAVAGTGLTGEDGKKEEYAGSPLPETTDDGCFTETLAKIYIRQHRYEKALEIIKKLSLNYPKKNAYFADQIRFLEKLIINTKSK